jgi:hypothetical protein
MESCSIAVQLNYIKRTGAVINKIRNGKSYDDSSGCMIPNVDLIKMFYYKDIFNFYRLSPETIIIILKQYFLGFEGISFELVDADVIKNVILEILK